MRRYIIFILIFLPLTALVAQDIEKVRDSLRKELAYAKVDTIRIILLNELAANYWLTRYDSGIYFSQEALLSSRKMNYLDGEAHALILLGLSHTSLGNAVKGYEYISQAVTFSESTGNQKRLGDALTALGENRRENHPDEALSILYRAYEINQSQNPDYISLNETQLATIYASLDQSDSAIFYAKMAYRRFEDPMPFIIGTLGEVYYDLGEIDLAKHYYNLAIDKSLQTEQYGNTSWFYRDLAMIFNNMSESDSAFYYAGLSYSKALESRSYYSIVKSCNFLSDLYAPFDPEKALEYKRIGSLNQDTLYYLIEEQAIASIQGFDQQLKEIELDKVESEFQSRQRTNAFLGSSFTLLVIAFFLYRNSRNSRRAKEKIQGAYSELKDTQTQLIHSEKMASLGELTAGIAHEIQNPLNFVNNFSDLNSELVEELREEVKKGNTQEAEAIIKDIEENEKKILHHGKRADGIVKGMLQHSRAGGGEKEPTDINELADEYLRLAYHGLRAKDKSFNADFKTELDPDLPKVNVIPQDIGRVLLNLINNAFYAVSARAKQSQSHASTGSASTSDDYKPTVTVSTELMSPSLRGIKGEGKIEIRVKDNGPGIPYNIKDKIFQPFFTTKATGEGTGLGLSLSYDIVKAHGGIIEVQSEKGKGTDFTIQLPIV